MQRSQTSTLLVHTTSHQPQYEKQLSIVDLDSRPVLPLIITMLLLLLLLVSLFQPALHCPPRLALCQSHALLHVER